MVLLPFQSRMDPADAVVCRLTDPSFGVAPARPIYGRELLIRRSIGSYRLSCAANGRCTRLLSAPSRNVDHVDDGSQTLDVEYREFVRSLHKEAVSGVVAISAWWNEAAHPIAHLATIESSDEVPTEADIRAAKTVVNQWDNSISPELSKLRIGHPDPDVRAAAKFVAHRIFATIFVLRGALSGEPARSPQHAEATNRVVGSWEKVGEAIGRLSHFVQQAPLRVHRPPQPELDPLESEKRPPDFPLWFEQIEEEEAAAFALNAAQANAVT